MAAGDTRRRRKGVLLGLSSVALLAAMAAVFVLWPLWSYSTLTRARLAWAGIHGHSLSLDGLRVHYLEGGKGKPVVLVHGLGSRSQDWAPLLPELVRGGFHVVAMDLPGFGETSKPKDRTYSISEQAHFVESFLDAMGLERVTLVGVSMGGWIAATVALDAPQRVERLVLMDSAGFAFRPVFDTGLFVPRTSTEVDALLALLIPRPQRLPNFVKGDVVRSIAAGGWVIERALASMAVGTDVLDARFSSMKPPLLLIWGKQDRITPLTLGEAMHKAAPASVLEVFDGCGHVAFQTCAMRVAPTLLRFLAGNGPAPGSTIDVPAG
jgi:pimeloyl-ACP methyl ester carboxylesterase